ncbi:MULTISPECIES: DUF1684 domain-containing protein [Ignavibacterium]|jgi:hypothetical protein|uniref:DUF1684 domain-containing protein n=1 Tax=Ignavibacterium TaxID=795750 RepID=UPI0025C5EAE2|nr:MULTISPECIES: DUF1684 domain-containing protein [Ignavibacterium]MBI5661920.1 DUF1684 domain-containing protein [Ignavibacterium album]
MIKPIKLFSAGLIVLFFLLTGSNCSDENKTELTKSYLTILEQERADRNWQMQYNPKSSPFLMDTSVKYEPLKFYEPNAGFIFKSKLHRIDNPDSVEIYGTKGTSRKYLRYGYFNLKFRNNDYKLYLYNITTPDGMNVYNIWFKDATTGKETFEHGRYLKFEKNLDDDFEYTIDFNRAINPLCAYSDLFNCPVPSEQDSLPFEVKAGEKKFR